MYRSEDNVTGYQPLRVVDLETVRSVKAVGKLSNCTLIPLRHSTCDMLRDSKPGHSPIPERKKGFLIELLDETMMLQCTSKADMEDWVRDVNRLRGGRVDLASGQNLDEFPSGQDIYEGEAGRGRREAGERERGEVRDSVCSCFDTLFVR